MFAITAITGKVGGAVARTLLRQGAEVRAVVRERSKGMPWAERGCDVAVADVDRAEPLAAALEGVRGAFILLPPVFDPSPDFAESRTRIAAIRDALNRSSPARVVVLSTIGADTARPNLLNALRLLERGLADVSLPITFLRAAWFMENAAWDLSSARDDGVIRSYLQPLDRRIAMVATDDVGRVAAELLQEEWVGHRVVELEGPARTSPDAVAAAFARALGRPVAAEAVPRANWERIFREQGMANPLPRMQMIDGFNEGWIDFTDDRIRKGRITIDQAIAAVVEGHP